eukprot:TRINITY_DN696_c0_g1_i4.p1 TRINITY_DN696_c0_g1~~TRINITY_DN696_c0_g1_i4.p1  ORF type:complete len:482 (-),score=35.18 TRINITY_DN696_c0_g1_i4:367-1812(-)
MMKCLLLLESPQQTSEEDTADPTKTAKRMESEKRVVQVGGHAVAVAVPGQGHINPMMNLCKKLAAKGIAISFVLTHSWKNIISDAYKDTGKDEDRDAFTNAKQLLGLPIDLVCIPDCVPGEFDRWKNSLLFYRSLAKIESHVRALITDTLSSSQYGPVSCLIADVFLGWAPPLAKSLGLASVSLCPQSLAALSVFYHRDLVLSQMGSEIRVPGIDTPLLDSDLPASFRESKDHPIAQITENAMKQLDQTGWIVSNSCSFLEAETEKALKKHINIHCAGPLLPSSSLSCTDSRDMAFGTSSRRETDCTQWLDSRPPRSVIYVSFGSLMPVSAAELEEIATGIKESEYSFLWVARDDEALPVKLLEGVEERGMVVRWCAQMSVLSHVSIGGFLSHCGWNSTMESICNGVPMLCLPLGHDQWTNSKMIVNVWRFGVSVREDNKRAAESAHVAFKVRRPMQDTELRRRAQMFRKFAAAEVVLILL